MTFFILAEIATFSFDGEFNDISYDIHQVEANDELSARESLRHMITEQGARVGKMQVEAVTQDHLSDSWY